MTARQANPRRVLLDINVLFYDFLLRNPTYGSKTPPTHELRNRKQSNEALTYIRQGRLFRTFVADFSIAKFISLMQQVKAPKALQIDEVENLLTKNEVVSLGGRLIKSILEETKNKPLVKDMEDAYNLLLHRIIVAHTSLPSTKPTSTRLISGSSCQAKSGAFSN